MTAPRVAIEARSLQRRPAGGVARGLGLLLPHVARQRDVLLLTDSRLPGLGVPNERPVRTRIPGPEVIWRNTAVRRALRGLDGVFHGPWYAVPLWCPCPSVVTLHDLSFEVHPEDLSPLRREVMRRQARHAAGRCELILTESEFVAHQIEDVYGVRRDRIRVIPWGVDPLFSPRVPEPELLARAGLTLPYVVALGGARRRGVEVAVEAWTMAQSDGLGRDLAVLGSHPPFEGVVSLGRLDDEAWAQVLAGADALIYPTRYEGWGMPAIEALAAGTPVVCAAVGPLPEVLDDAPQWADSSEPADIAAALHALITDRATWESRRQRGLEVAAGLASWESVAAAHLRAYDDCWQSSSRSR